MYISCITKLHVRFIGFLQLHVYKNGHLWSNLIGQNLQPWYKKEM